MSEQENTSSMWPLSGAVILMTLLGGSFLLDAPFLTLRSPSSRLDELKEDHLESVSARLWQDPLALVYRVLAEKNNTDKGKKAPVHGHEEHLFYLAREIDAWYEQHPDKSLQLLPVSVPGGIYAEDGETRRRVRHAVIGGLAEDGFVPQRPEHIGFFQFAFPPGWNEVNRAGAPVPFEWYVNDGREQKPSAAELKSAGDKWIYDTYLCKLLHKNSAYNPKPHTVLVLWVTEDFFYEKQQIRVLLQHLMGFRFFRDFSRKNLVENSVTPLEEDQPIKPTRETEAPKSSQERTRITLLGPHQSQTLLKFRKPTILNELEPAIALPSEKSPQAAAEYLVDRLDIKGRTLSVDEKIKLRTPLAAWLENQNHASDLHQIKGLLAQRLAISGALLEPWIEQHKDYFYGDLRPAGVRLPKITLLSSYATASLDHLTGEKPVLDENKKNKANLPLDVADPSQAVQQQVVARKRQETQRVGRDATSGKTTYPISDTEQKFAEGLTDAQFTGYHALNARDDMLAALLMHELRVRGDHLARVRSFVKNFRRGEIDLSDAFTVLFEDFTTEDGRGNAPLLLLGDRLETVFQEPIPQKNGSGDNLLGGKMVLVGEWDTFYARSLRDSVRESAKTWLHMNDRDIIEVGYLRGLDGIIPGEERAERLTDEELRSSSKANLEQPVGKSQLDYVRRLAQTLERRALQDSNKVRAIGILGSDLYDKQMILQALRPRFPKTLFFTTDLDARMLHPSQYPWTRNLIIASAYGLAVRPEIQGTTPPFRDNYQTATFLATRAALRDVPTDAYIADKPAIYEVARDRAYLLNNDPYDIHPDEQRPTLTRILRTRGLSLLPFLLIILAWIGVDKLKHWWAATGDTRQVMQRRFSRRSTGEETLSEPLEEPEAFEAVLDLPAQPALNRISKQLASWIMPILSWLPWYFCWFTLAVIWMASPTGTRFYLFTPLAIVVAVLLWMLGARNDRDAAQLDRVEKKPLLERLKWVGYHVAGYLLVLGLILSAVWAEWYLLVNLMIPIVSWVLLLQVPRTRENLKGAGNSLLFIGLISGWCMTLILAFATGKPYPLTVLVVFLCYLVGQFGLPKNWRPFFAIAILFSLVLFMLGVVDHDLGEPFVWAAGISTWPSIIISWFVVLVGAFFAVAGHRKLKDNQDDIKDYFHLNNIDQSNTASAVWHRYTLGNRVIPSVMWSGLLWLGMTIFAFSESQPKPTRGAVSYLLDGLIFSLVGLLLIYLVVFALEHTRACVRFIREIASDKNVVWNAEARDQLACKLEANDGIQVVPSLLDDMLDLKLITRRTEVVSNLIVYPFIVVFLDLLAHNTWFDHWSRPFAAYLFLGFISCVTLACALWLRLESEKARQHAIDQLETRIAELQGDEEREGLRQVREQMVHLAEGALAPWSRHPILKAILWPLGGISTLAVGEYLMLLFQ